MGHGSPHASWFQESGSAIAAPANANEPAARSGADGFGDPVMVGRRGGRPVPPFFALWIK
jgi:hypothetical protein